MGVLNAVSVPLYLNPMYAEPRSPFVPGGFRGIPGDAEPGKTNYAHIADNYAPFSTKMVNVGVRDSTYVLD